MIRFYEQNHHLARKDCKMWNRFKLRQWYCIVLREFHISFKYQARIILIEDGRSLYFPVLEPEPVPTTEASPVTTLIVPAPAPVAVPLPPSAAVVMATPEADTPPSLAVAVPAPEAVPLPVNTSN